MLGKPSTTELSSQPLSSSLDAFIMHYLNQHTVMLKKTTLFYDSYYVFYSSLGQAYKAVTEEIDIEII